MLFSLLGFGIDYLFLSFAPTIGWLFVGRVIAGITGASFTTAAAYIADISTNENRAQNFGMIGAAFGLGFIIGIELAEKDSIRAFRGVEKAASLQLVNHLHDAGMLTVPSGTQVVRLLPAYNLTRQEACEAVAIIERTVASLQ